MFYVKNLLVTGFELRTSGVGSDHFVNRATTTDLDCSSFIYLPIAGLFGSTYSAHVIIPFCINLIVLQISAVGLP